jgi:Ni/Fe-hydrogenase subunit HybB-like protein
MMLLTLKSYIPFLEHAGTAGLLVLGLLAAAWFSPVFKKDFVYAAIVVGVGLIVYDIGVHDEHTKRNIDQAIIEKKVQTVVEDAQKDTHKDPFDDPHN